MQSETVSGASSVTLQLNSLAQHLALYKLCCSTGFIYVQDAKDTVDSPFFLLSVTYSTIMSIKHCLDPFLFAFISVLTPNI